MISAIVLLCTGIVLGIGGCIVSAVGFGLSAQDMYDYMSLALRVTGMLMLHFCVLPLTVSICCWIFYSWSKREDKERTKQGAFVVGTKEAVPMAQYPYPTSGVKDTRIYKPQQQSRYANVDPDDSSAPLNFSGDSSSRYPADTSSPQPVTSGSSFDDDQTAVKGRRPKKGKKAQQAAAASIDEQQAMVSGGGSYKT